MSAGPDAGREGRTLVVGLGNRWRGDDGAGLLVARRLRDLAPRGLEAIELEGEPTRLIDALADRAPEAVVLVDAARGGERPGTVSEFDLARGPLPATLAPGSTHAIGLPQTVELARATGRLPARASAYAIAGERFEAGAALTPAVRRAAVELAARLANATG